MSRRKPIGSSKGETYGHVPEMLRIYLQEGETPATWQDNADCKLVKTGQACLLSKKARDYEWLDFFLGTVPTTIGKLRVVVDIHEPENDPLTPADYLRGAKRDAAIIRSRGFIPVQVLMNARDPRWKEYASPDVAEMWWDPYQGGAGDHPLRYNPPSKFLGPIESASASRGKSWGLAEVGSWATVEDTTEVGRANWMVDLRKYLLGNATCRGACWYNHRGNIMSKQMANAWFAGIRP